MQQVPQDAKAPLKPINSSLNLDTSTILKVSLKIIFLYSITMNLNSSLTGSKPFIFFLVVTDGATEAVVFAR